MFLGRSDRQVKINGRRVELDEIEAIMRRHPMVAEAAVVLDTAGEGAKRLLCFVQPGAGAAEVAAAVHAHARAVLPEHMMPSRIVVLRHFPMTPSGKIDRRALRLPAELPAAAAPASTLEDRIRALWQRALGRADVGLDENFFDLGGTSLQLIGVHAQLQAREFPELKVLDLFARPTIRQLAASLSRPAPAATLDAVRQRGLRQNAALHRLRAGTGGR
jgi:hypothetical protein